MTLTKLRQEMIGKVWRPLGYKKRCSNAVFQPVEGRVLLQNVHVDVLLNEAVEQDGQRGEADVV